MTPANIERVFELEYQCARTDMLSGSLGRRSIVEGKYCLGIAILRCNEAKRGAQSRGTQIGQERILLEVVVARDKEIGSGIGGDQSGYTS